MRRAFIIIFFYVVRVCLKDLKRKTILFAQVCVIQRFIPFKFFFFPSSWGCYFFFFFFFFADAFLFQLFQFSSFNFTMQKRDCPAFSIATSA